MEIVNYLAINMNHILLQKKLKEIKTFAALSDQEGLFPEQEFNIIRQAGLLHLTLKSNPYGYEPLQTFKLLEVLKWLGSASLSVGRIYEGHVNALQLIDLYGNSQQKEKYFQEVFENKSLFGVWNTQDQNGVKIIDLGNGKLRLEGAKTFCSGANWIQRPLLTGELISKNGKGWQMFILPTEKVKEVKVDSSFWKPLGMRSSASFKMDFSKIIIDQTDLIGAPDAYYRPPFFSAGAVRFAAVQLGGAQAILEQTHQFLREHNRTEDSFQRTRVAEIAYLVETGNLWMSRAAELIDTSLQIEDNNQKVVEYINMFRSVVNDLCLKVMQLSERSVGARGLMRPYELERVHRDLTTYLRQPAPDATLVSIGKHVLDRPNLDSLWS